MILFALCAHSQRSSHRFLSYALLQIPADLPHHAGFFEYTIRQTPLPQIWPDRQYNAALYKTLPESALQRSSPREMEATESDRLYPLKVCCHTPLRHPLPDKQQSRLIQLYTERPAASAPAPGWKQMPCRCME